MCGLCGVLGGRGHWTESATNPDAFAARAEQGTSLRERQQRTRIVNQVLGHYGLGLKDWSGNAYILKGNTGKTAIVDNLAQMWSQAETLTGRSFDPLADDLIADLTGH
jgi:hypothetical protein